MKQISCIGSLNSDKYIFNNNIIYKYGGSAANTAFHLRNLLNSQKYQVNLIGLVGDDKRGKQMINYYNNNLISTKYVKIETGRTGLASIIHPSNERIISRHISVTQKLPPYLDSFLKSTGLEDHLIHMKASLSATQIVFSYIPNIFSWDFSGILPNYNVENLKERKSSFNIFWNTYIRKRTVSILLGNLKEYSQLLFLLDYLKDWNDNSSLKSSTIINPIRKILTHLNSHYAFIKNNKKGAVVITPNRYIQANSISVPIKDTTGAGDAFNAAIIYGFQNNLDLMQILKLGVSMGSLVCTEFGAQNPKINLSFLKEQSHAIHCKESVS